MEIQVSVNIGGSAVGVVWRLNWTGSVIVTSPNYNEARVLATSSTSTTLTSIRYSVSANFIACTQVKSKLLLPCNILIT